MSLICGQCEHQFPDADAINDVFCPACGCDQLWEDEHDSHDISAAEADHAREVIES